MDAIHNANTIKHICINCGHSTNSIILNAPIAFEAETGNCDSYCLYVAEIDGRWAVDPNIIRQQVQPKKQ